MTASFSLPRRNTSGTALLEALITLPVFAATLAGVLALNSMYVTKLEAKSRARRLAWLQADSGECPAQSCRSGDCGRIEDAIQADGLDRLLTTHGGHFSLGSFIGGVGRYLLGRVTRGVGLAEGSMPNIVGSGTTSQYGVTTLLCNTTQRDSSTGDNVLEHACRTGLRTMEYANEVCR